MIWPWWGRTPRWHRHRWSTRRVTVPMWDRSSRGDLHTCTVCGRVEAR